MVKEGEWNRLTNDGKGVLMLKYKVLSNYHSEDKTASKLSREENEILPLC